VLGGAVVEDSLVSGGTRVAGEVRGSVLSPGVVVEKGATVVDSILLPGVRVRSGATVTRAVLDDGVEVGSGATVGGEGDGLEGIALVGRRAAVPEGGEVPVGGRLPEPEEDR
jgi:glucose-1-phosphate adenylyltransferase